MSATQFTRWVVAALLLAYISFLLRDVKRIHSHWKSLESTQFQSYRDVQNDSTPLADTNTTTHPPNNIPVFYNLFVANDADADRVLNLVHEQFTFLESYHTPVYLNSIGYPLNLTTNLSSNQGNNTSSNNTTQPNMTTTTLTTTTR